MIYLNILLALAVIPGLFFMWKVYQLDKIESEPKKLIVKLMIFGALVAIPVVIVELVLDVAITSLFLQGTILYYLIDNFIGVALIEETGKFIVARSITWRHPAFNYKFDGVVYAVAASMGFAILENIEYCLMGGISTALMRAVLSIPGHGIFGIFMGHYYGLAKDCQHDGDVEGMIKNRRKALLIPVLIHGFYDFCLSTEIEIMFLVFWIFIAVLYFNAFKKIREYSRTDEVF